MKDHCVCVWYMYIMRWRDLIKVTILDINLVNIMKTWDEIDGYILSKLLYNNGYNTNDLNKK